MKDVCFQKYIYSKCLQNKLLGTRLYVLDFILNKKEMSTDYILIDNLIYYHISRIEIAMNTIIDEQSVSTILKFLKNKGFIQTFYDCRHKKLYIAPIINICKEYIIPDNESIIEDKNVLFEYQEKKFSKISEELITRLIEKNKDLFGTRIPKKNNKPSISFTRACQFLDDIYNGNVTNPRLHSTINSLDSKECAFPIYDWRTILEKCKNNWNEIHKLLNKAVKNYRLMKDTNRMPMKKTSLPRGIDLWFEDTYSNNSYFIYCFNEPPLIKDRNNEKIADEIYDSLPISAQKEGNKLFGLNTSMPDAQFWIKIKDMMQWGNTLCKYDANAHYWISKGSDLLSKFYDYLIDNSLTISITTIDIKKAVECNGPWVWFLNEAIVRHNLNTDIISCCTADELRSYYEKRKA